MWALRPTGLQRTTPPTRLRRATSLIAVAPCEACSDLPTAGFKESQWAARLCKNRDGCILHRGGLGRRVIPVSLIKPDVRTLPHSCRGKVRAYRYRNIWKEIQQLHPSDLWGWGCVRSNADRHVAAAARRSKPNVRKPPHSRRGGFRA